MRNMTSDNPRHHPSKVPLCHASLEASFCYDKPHTWELKEGEQLLEILARELPADEVADVWMGGYMEVKVDLKRPEDFEHEKARVDTIVQRCWAALIAPKFYEVCLSDCDGANATIHLWSDGRVDLGAAHRNKVKRLARLRLESKNDPEMPDWARPMMEKLET